MDVRDVHRAIAKLDDGVAVQEVTPQNVLDRRGVGAIFVVRGQLRRVDGAALYSWMVEDLAGGATISERLLPTVRGGFG